MNQPKDEAHDRFLVVSGHSAAALTMMMDSLAKIAR